MPPRRIRLKRTDIWREGKWLDLWSVVHFFSGISAALILSRFGFPFAVALIIAVAIFVAYEFWEAAMHIRETPQNRAMDVVVGMASFMLAYASGLTALSRHDFIVAASWTIGINVILASFGWYASQKAIELEERVRRTMALRREKLRAMRERLLARRRKRSDDRL